MGCEQAHEASTNAAGCASDDSPRTVLILQIFQGRHGLVGRERKEVRNNWGVFVFPDDEQAVVVTSKLLRNVIANR